MNQVPIGEFQKQVTESLQLLEQQPIFSEMGTFIVIDQHRKGCRKRDQTTSISDSDQIKLLSDIIFNAVIQTKQYRFDDNRQITFARK